MGAKNYVFFCRNAFTDRIQFLTIYNTYEYVNVTDETVQKMTRLQAVKRRNDILREQRLSGYPSSSIYGYEPISIKLVQKPLNKKDQE